MKASASDPTPAAICLQAARQGDHDRYLCALFAADAARPALMALLAFNGEVARTRESVSEPTLGLIRLQWWREALDGAFAGVPRRHPVVEALAAAVGVHGLDRALFDRLIEARERDLDDLPIASLADMELYAEGTSATMFELWAEVLGGRDPASRAAVRHAGLAWALVGLVRAVPFHGASRRLFLPESELASEGVDIEALFAGRATAGLDKVVGRVLDRAAQHGAAARALKPDLARGLLPALLPVRLADSYARQLTKAGLNPFRPIRLNPVAKQLGLMAAAMTGRF